MHEFKFLAHVIYYQYFTGYPNISYLRTVRSVLSEPYRWHWCGESDNLNHSDKSHVGVNILHIIYCDKFIFTTVIFDSVCEDYPSMHYLKLNTLTIKSC